MLRCRNPAAPLPWMDIPCHGSSIQRAINHSQKVCLKEEQPGEAFPPFIRIHRPRCRFKGLLKTGFQTVRAVSRPPETSSSLLPPVPFPCSWRVQAHGAEARRSQAPLPPHLPLPPGKWKAGEGASAPPHMRSFQGILPA